MGDATEGVLLESLQIVSGELSVRVFIGRVTDGMSAVIGSNEMGRATVTELEEVLLSHVGYGHCLREVLFGSQLLTDGTYGKLEALESYVET